MRPISVLLVDDSPLFVEAATAFLRASGIVAVESALGGTEGLSRAAESRPDIVLVDLAMPDLPGLELIPQLRQIVPVAGIIAVTLLPAASYREAALALGADDLVTKASLTTDLLPAIRRVTQMKELPGKPTEPTAAGA